MFRRFVVCTCLVLALVDGCPSREKSLDCFYATADLNQDGVLSRKELGRAISSRLPWWKNAAFHLFGGLQRVFNDCDANHDGQLTKAESLTMTATCMDSCYKKRQTYELFQCH
jgi:hypothetical protein